MDRLFFGKFSPNYPEQISERFYAAGIKGNDWYGGIEPGDYVFPIYQGIISALWRVREYGNIDNKINKNGVVIFDEVKKYKEPIRLTDEFTMYKYFEHDLNLVNKSSKMVRNCSFHQIKVSQNCPPVEDIEFKGNLRKIYIVLDSKKVSLNDYDIVVSINNLDDTKISGIKMYMNNTLSDYKTLQDLYNEKNGNNKYSIKRLIEYGKQDSAPNKIKYLNSVLKELEENEVFTVANPIALYDNLLVGRKRSAPSKPSKGVTTIGGVDEDEILEDDSTEYYKYAELLNFNPNLILYGPPGTGKTFSTKKIVEAFDRSSTESKSIKFEEIEKQGRVKFITFHQAYSYEEFLEGIRPRVIEDSEQSSGLKYVIEDGILKQMANLASIQILKSDSKLKGMELVTNSSRIWKVSLGSRNKGENIYKDCKDNSEIAIEWLKNDNLEGKSYDEIFGMLKNGMGAGDPVPTQDANSIDAFVNEMNIGDMVLIYDGPKTIRDIGIIKEGYHYGGGKDYPHTRKVVWLKEYKEPADIYEYNGQTRLTLKTVYLLYRFNFSDLINLIRQDEKKNDQLQGDNKSVPYYLIIDEINRGNISKIFGELITLIEKDKRGTFSCILPYSKKPFSMPDNLYIIGTMNTADRSIALLDTALRRRFSFVEIEPDLSIFNNPELIASPRVNNNVDLAKLLGRLNKEITSKLDRDHRIGHSYFMDIISLSDLYNVWYYKVLPLLMEYFYGDIDTLKGVTGPGFFDPNGSVIFLNKKDADGQISEFETALMKIYSTGN